MTRVHATGNVFTDPDKGVPSDPAKRVLANPTNVVARQSQKTTAWGPGAGAADGVAGGTDAVPATGLLELDDVGTPIPAGTDIAAKAAESDVRTARAAIADLAKQLHEAGTAAGARAMLTTCALHEYARPDGGRKTVLADLKRLGITPG